MTVVGQLSLQGPSKGWGEAPPSCGFNPHLPAPLLPVEGKPGLSCVPRWGGVFLASHSPSPCPPAPREEESHWQMSQAPGTWRPAVAGLRSPGGCVDPSFAAALPLAEITADLDLSDPDPGLGWGGSTPRRCEAPVRWPLPALGQEKGEFSGMCGWVQLAATTWRPPGFAATPEPSG